MSTIMYAPPLASTGSTLYVRVSLQSLLNSPNAASRGDTHYGVTGLLDWYD
jgi:hypothetical protein